MPRMPVSEPGQSSQPVIVLAGKRTKDARLFFEERFSRAEVLQANLELPRERVVPGTRTIIFSAHSAHVRDYASTDRRNIVGIAEGETARVYKILGKPDNLYWSGATVAEKIAEVAQILKDASSEVGSPKRPVRVFIASCYAGLRSQDGTIDRDVAERLSRDGISFDVFASRGDIENGERTGFRSKGLGGRQLLAAMDGASPNGNVRKNGPWTHKRDARAARGRSVDPAGGSLPGEPGASPFRIGGDDAGGPGASSASNSLPGIGARSPVNRRRPLSDTAAHPFSRSRTAGTPTLPLIASPEPFQTGGGSAEDSA